MILRQGPRNIPGQAGPVLEYLVKFITLLVPGNGRRSVNSAAEPNPGSGPPQEAGPEAGRPERPLDRQPYTASDWQLLAVMQTGIAHCRMLWEEGQPRDWVYLRVNQAFERQTGLRDPVGRRVSELVPGLLEQDPGWLRLYGEVARTGLPTRFERQVAALGLWLDIAVYSPARDEFVAVCVDVTERKRAEQALLESQARYRSLFETVPRGIQDLTRLLREQETILEGANVGISMIVDRRQVWVNRWMEQTFQYSKEEMLGRTTRMFYRSQEAYDRLGAEAYPLLAVNEAYETVVELLRKDGRSVWIHYNGRTVDPMDPGRGTLWVLTDVTAARLVEDELRRSEARFRAMFETHNSVMLLVDPEADRIVDANPAAARFYGYSRETLQEMPISGINALPPAELKQALGQAESMRQNAFVFPHRLASGELRTVEVNSSPMEVQGRRLLFSIIMDVTARVAYERELKERQAQLTELNRTLAEKVRAAVEELRRKDRALVSQGRQAAMGEMIGNIAHQWRQPLGTLSMLLANLRDAYRYRDLDRERMEDAFAKGDLLIQKMSSTIGDFQNFFNPDKEKVAFPARRQIQRAVALVDASFEAGRVRIQVDAPAEVWILGFPNEFSQVLLNLLTNARQAILEAGRGDGQVTLRLDVMGGVGRIRVRDNGTGVPDAFLDRIFDPYFSTRATGTGIGLHMSRQIIQDSMGGRILARNLDQGAEIEVLVPLAD